MFYRSAAFQVAFRFCKNSVKQFCTAHGTKSTVAVKEVSKFENEASDWWTHGGKFATLRAMNVLRIPFIHDGLSSVSSKNISKFPKPLENFQILDVGCGGGFLSEPLARLGATVTGLDPSPECIRIADEHYKLHYGDITGKLTYVCGSVEDLVKENKVYDVVVCSEVLEHVDNVEVFLQHCVELTKQNGSLFFTTVNRTFLSYVVAILLAEHVLHKIPKGTHDYQKFVPISDLQNILESQGCKIHVIYGLTYNPLTQSWQWTSCNAVGYAVHATKGYSKWGK